MVKKYVCIPRSFLVRNIFNQGKTLCSPCISCSNIVLDNIQGTFKSQKKPACFEVEYWKGEEYYIIGLN